MEHSILKSIKKALGIADEYTAFDMDIIMHINSVFSTLHQLGVGPREGFFIEDSQAKWSQFLGTNLNINSVKSYVYLRVRLLFDPPNTSFAVESFKKQAQELEWRLNVEADTTYLPTDKDDEDGES